jgi:hypothetical protein
MASTGIPPLINLSTENPMKKMPRHCMVALIGAAVLFTVGCTSSLKTPATADVAVSKAAVDNALSAGGVQYAPQEMNAAREKLALANKAMAAKDYKAAADFAKQAQVDAKLAQSKADSTKAQAAAAAIQDDIRVLREELERTGQWQ